VTSAMPALPPTLRNRFINPVAYPSFSRGTVLNALVEEARLKPDTTYCRSLPGRMIPGEAVATGSGENLAARRDIDEIGVGRLDLAQDTSG
jgi:hypothetical protein